MSRAWYLKSKFDDRYAANRDETLPLLTDEQVYLETEVILGSVSYRSEKKHEIHTHTSNLIHSYSYSYSFIFMILFILIHILIHSYSFLFILIHSNLHIHWYILVFFWIFLLPCPIVFHHDSSFFYGQIDVAVGLKDEKIQLEMACKVRNMKNHLAPEMSLEKDGEAEFEKKVRKSHLDVSCCHIGSFIAKRTRWVRRAVSKAAFRANFLTEVWPTRWVWDPGWTHVCMARYLQRQ